MTSKGVLEDMEIGVTFDILVEFDGWADVGLDRLCQQVGKAVAGDLGLEQRFEVSLLACDDARIVELNRAFREKPVPTNVLSWPSVDLTAKADGDMPALEDAQPELGDIAIAYETCLREANLQGKTLEAHVTHLCIHGLLHLFGFDHIRPKDADLMEAIESRILAKLGISDPYEM